jgi:hypothetical protein
MRDHVSARFCNRLLPNEGVAPPACMQTTAARLAVLEGGQLFGGAGVEGARGPGTATLEGTGSGRAGEQQQREGGSSAACGESESWADDDADAWVRGTLLSGRRSGRHH